MFECGESVQFGGYLNGYGGVGNVVEVVLDGCNLQC